jgi:hypothetical protein
MRSDVGATGLSGDRDEYLARLREQPDEQIDAWAMEAMRDFAIRGGVLRVLDDFRRASGLDDAGVGRVFAAGDGPPALVGRDREGRLLIPAVALHCLVRGTRAAVPGAREALIGYLAGNFEELVFV